MATCNLCNLKGWKKPLVKGKAEITSTTTHFWAETVDAGKLTCLKQTPCDKSTPQQLVLPVPVPHGEHEALLSRLHLWLCKLEGGVADAQVGHLAVRAQGQAASTRLKKICEPLPKVTFGGLMRKTYVLVGKKWFSPNIPWQNAPKSTMGPQPRPSLARKLVYACSRGPSWLGQKCPMLYRGIQIPIFDLPQTQDLTSPAGCRRMVHECFPGCTWWATGSWAAGKAAWKS